MKDISTAIIRRCIPQIASAKSSIGGIREWITQGAYQISEKSSPETIILEGSNLTDIIPYWAFDYERFALSSWETFCICSVEFAEKRHLSWPLLKLYYASFFGAHSILRATGKSVTRLEDRQAKFLTQLSELFLADGLKITSGSYIVDIEQISNTRINVHLNRIQEERGGAHSTFWKIFNDFLTEKTTEIVHNKEANALNVSNAISELKSVLKSHNSTTGNWLSNVRNSINYQHEYSVWFPHDRNNPAIDGLRGISLKERPTLRLDIDCKKNPLLAFINASQYIIHTSFDLSEFFKTRSSHATHFGGKWKRLRTDFDGGMISSNTEILGEEEVEAA